MADHCPTCGQPLPAADLVAECQRRGFVIRYPDLLAEADAAQLLGYSSADTLRKQAAESRNRLEFVRRGNRRFYSLQEIAHHLAQ